MKKKATKVIPPDGKTFTKAATHPDLVPVVDAGLCFCRKPAQFTSEKLGQVFCSEKCYQQAWDAAERRAKKEVDEAVTNPRYRFEERVQQLVDKGTPRVAAEKIVRDVILNKELPGDRAHIHITPKGECHFVCGEISFVVDSQDLNKVIGTNGEPNPLHRLMDSQIAEMARSQGWTIDPFARELIEVPLQGLLQNVWYRDVEKHTSEHLEAGQAKRVAEYHHKLSQWKPSSSAASGNHGSRRASSGAPRASMVSKSFEVVKGEHADVASGRESDLFAAIKKLKSPMTFSQIVEAAKGNLKTKQDFEKIVARFVKELVGHGAIKETK